jgi:L-lysine exporter family protein LysE/ArgO
VITYYFQGLILGAALILPLGPQNAFVMNQGIRRQYHHHDGFVVYAERLAADLRRGVWRQRLVDAISWLLGLVTWGGVAFLLWYGYGALKTAFGSISNLPAPKR